jgi:Methyltransferase domain
VVHFSAIILKEHSGGWSTFGLSSGHFWTIKNKHLHQKYPRVTFKNADIEKLPFKDNEFDTIVSTHTLEHVQDIFQAISELRRVAKKRIILVVPKQRPYKSTFDLHIHFFPYPHSLQAIMGNKNKSICKEVGGDLFYLETKKIRCHTECCVTTYNEKALNGGQT